MWGFQVSKSPMMASNAINPCLCKDFESLLSPCFVNANHLHYDAKHVNLFASHDPPRKPSQSFDLGRHRGLSHLCTWCVVGTDAFACGA